MTKRLLVLSVGLLLSTSALYGDDVDLHPEDFAYGRQIEVDRSSPLQTVLLDLHVYRGCVEPHLADLRVFNAAGEAVPHAIRRLAAPKSVQGERVPVPLFRLAEPAAGAPSEVGSEERTYHIEAEVSEDGAVLSVTSGPRADSAAAAAEIPGAYLVDTSQIERDITGLEFELGNEAAEFIVPVRVEASDDLAHFRPIATAAALARLDQSGHRIEISDVAIHVGRYRYLRLSWPETKLPVEIVAAHARLGASNEAPARHHAQVAGARVAGVPDAFVFDLGGTIPVDWVQIDLPDPNTLVEARLFSAPDGDGPWTTQYSGLLFELENERLLRNSAIHWPANRHRYVKLMTSSKGGGLGSGTPLLEVEWFPEQLLFITRGQPPYRLAYGRAGAAGSRFDAMQLLQTTGTAPDDVPRAIAALGEEYGVAPRSVLLPSKEPVSMRAVALWAVLVLSVMVALALSIRLARQIQGEP
jgi:hypothetical protein